MSRLAAYLLSAAIATALVAAWVATQRPEEGAAPTADTASSEPVPPVRVLIGPSHRDSCQLRIDGPYRVTPPGDWRVLAQGKQLAPSEVRATDSGFAIGDREFPLRRIDVEIVKPGTLWIGDRRYEGRLRLVRQGADDFLAVNVVPLEQYLASVLDGEMPGEFPAAARRAQAIAARTYAVYHMKTGGAASDFDVVDSTAGQVYRGVEYEAADGRRLRGASDGARQLVRETEGIVAVYHDRLFCTFFSAVCGGQTARGSAIFAEAAPPLAGTECKFCSGAPNYRWTREIDFAKASERARSWLSSRGEEVGAIEDIRCDESSSNAATIVRLVTTTGDVTMAAQRFRDHVAGPERLPSLRFTASRQGEKLIIEGSGWGHGVGLCQWGARGLAESGRTTREILKYYYPGSTLSALR